MRSGAGLRAGLHVSTLPPLPSSRKSSSSFPWQQSPSPVLVKNVNQIPCPPPPTKHMTPGKTISISLSLALDFSAEKHNYQRRWTYRHGFLFPWSSGPALPKVCFPCFALASVMHSAYFLFMEANKHFLLLAIKDSQMIEALNLAFPGKEQQFRKTISWYVCIYQLCTGFFFIASKELFSRQL